MAADGLLLLSFISSLLETHICTCSHDDVDGALDMTSRPIQVVVHESLHVVASLERDFRGSKTINRPRRDRSLFKGPFRLTGAVDIATIHSDPSFICPFWRGRCAARKQAKPCVITKGCQWLPVFQEIPLDLSRILPLDLRPLTPEPPTILEEPARGTSDKRQRQQPHVKR